MLVTVWQPTISPLSPHPPIHPHQPFFARSPVEGRTGSLLGVWTEKGKLWRLKLLKGQAVSPKALLPVKGALDHLFWLRTCLRLGRGSPTGLSTQGSRANSNSYHIRMEDGALGRSLCYATQLAQSGSTTKSLSLWLVTLCCILSTRMISYARSSWEHLLA